MNCNLAAPYKEKYYNQKNMEMLLNYNELNKNRVYDTLDLCNGIHFNAIGQGDRVRICRYIFDSEDKMAARIVIISGACGTGKSSSSRLLAEKSPYDCAVHIHSDDFYQYIRKGYIAPWLEGSGKQNEIMIEAVAASAERFSAGGYEVFVDGTIGTWFLEPWEKIAAKGVDVRYVILRPDEQATILRATEREQKADFPLSYEVIKNIWRSFSDLGQYEANVVDTTDQTVEESIALIQERLQAGEFRLEE